MQMYQKADVWFVAETVWVYLLLATSLSAVLMTLEFQTQCAVLHLWTKGQCYF